MDKNLIIKNSLLNSFLDEKDSSNEEILKELY